MPIHGPSPPSAWRLIDRGADYHDWNSPQNAYALDGSTASAGSGVLNWTSNYLVLTGFGFAIPDEEHIVGVTLEIRCFGTIILAGPDHFVQEVGDETIQLCAEGSMNGYNRARPGETWPVDQSHADWRIYGAEDDLWGCELSPAVVSDDTNFGVVIAARAQEPLDPSAIAHIDAVRMTVSTRLPGVPLWAGSPLGHLLSTPRGPIGV